MLTTWVQAGGNLIAMRPDKKLAGLLGLTDAGATLANGYLKVDTGSAAGAGIDGADAAVPRHRRPLHAQRRERDRRRCTRTPPRRRPTRPSRCATSAPAAARPRPSRSTSRARSSTRARATRPGPATSATASPPLSIRPNDLFYGAKAGDVQPDWVDPDRFDVPQADEQQRLLANLITQMNLDKAPLPRFWYLPRGEKAAVILTGDDHARRRHARVLRPAQGGLAGRLLGRRLGVRARDLLRLSRHADHDGRRRAATRPTASRSALHLNTGCQDFTPASLEADAHEPARRVRARPGRASRPPVSNRTHCIVWSDWATQPKVERAHGIRFDTNYYYKGPAAWVTQARPDDRLRLPAALRRPRRHDDRRLPVDDAGHRRDGRASCRRRRRSTRCSTTRSARRTTTASSTSSCTPTTATTRG